jgi:hypothetical protein
VHVGAHLRAIGRRVVLAVGAVVLGRASLGAQTLEQAHRETRSVDAAPAAAPAIVPRSFQILKVAVPADFPADSPVTYQILPAPGVTVLSARRGTLAAASGVGGERVVLLTYGVPALAKAGSLPVASAVFAGGGHADTVAIGVEVATVHTVAVDLLQRARGTKPGGKIPLRYRISNHGNSADTIRIHYGLPYAWHTADHHDSLIVVLAPGASSVNETTVDVPNSASGGSYAIDVTATSADSTISGADKIYVEVPTLRQSPASKSVALNTTYSRVAGVSGSQSALMALAFSGQVYRDITLSVDATSAPSLNENGRYKLSSLGQFPQPPSVGLSAPGWRARFGGVGASFSDLAGQNAGGRGLSFSVEKPTFTLSTVLAGDRLGLANHTGGDTASSPTVIGARVGRQMLGKSWLVGTAAHLDEGSLPGARQLDVASIGTITPGFFGGTLENEIGVRKYREGSGLGLYSQFTRTKEDDRMQVRALYAPGGTEAYAPANASLTGFFNRKLNETWRLGGSMWGTSNKVNGAESAYSTGFAVNPYYALTPMTTLSMDVGGSSQRLTTGGIGFGNGEMHLSPIVNLASHKQTNLSLIGTVARITRDIISDSLGAVHNLSSARTAAQMNLSQGTPWFGTFTLSGGLSQDASNTVGLPRQNDISLRLDRFPLFVPGGYNLYATGLLQRLGWFGDRPSVFTVRGEIVAELPWNFTLGFSVDRNPLIALPGNGPWTTALRIGRTTYLGIPAWLRYGTRKGVVFQDLNANGSRDPREPGLGGVIVRRGDDYVTTDDDGSFKFSNGPDKRTERLLVDPRSLPEGWMDRGAPTREEDAKKVKAIGVIPTSAVRVRLAVRREDSGAAGIIDLTAVLVTAKDATGRVYAAQTVDATTQAFSELPPGDYQLTIDPSAAGQLQVLNAPTGFKIGAQTSGQDFDVELQTRAVRIKTFPSHPSTDPSSNAVPGQPASATSTPATPPASPAEPDTGSVTPKPRRATSAVADTVPLTEARKSRPKWTPPAPAIRPDTTSAPIRSDSAMRPQLPPVGAGRDSTVTLITPAPADSASRPVVKPPRRRAPHGVRRHHDS